jgi:hypothetical protein
MAEMTVLPDDATNPKPDLQPIAEAFAKADAAAEKRSKKDQDRKWLVDLIERKGESLAAKAAKAAGIPEASINKIINDRNAALAREEQAREEEQRAREESRNPPKGRGERLGEDQPRDHEDGAPPKEGERGSGQWVMDPNPVKPLPENCPVQPIGVNASGTLFYYLNPQQNLFEISSGGHSVHGLRELFGQRIDWLYQNFAKFNEKTGKQNGWKADRAAESLIAANFSKPSFDRFSVLREKGGWKDHDGNLVLHLGDRIWFKDQFVKPGFHDGHLYPASTACNLPAPKPENEQEEYSQIAMVNKLLSLLDSWKYKDIGFEEETVPYSQDIDGSGHKLASILKLGWHMAAKAGGALSHRPVIWYSGDTGTGKTTLLDVAKALHGDNLIKASNATQAGIWTVVGQSSQPVAVDEAENEAGSNRMKDVIRLARESATGGLILRGSSSHQGKQFTAQNSFAFSSIIIPPMLGQDLSRMCILQLDPLEGTAQLTIDMREIASMGNVLTRRLMDGWHRWPETFQTYWQALREQGHDPRGCNQFGTLLAMADLARFNGIADRETIAMLTAAMAAPAMNAAQDKTSNAEAMLNYLNTIPLDVFRGGTRMTIGRLVETGAGLLPQEDEAATPKACQAALEAWGIFFDDFKENTRIILPNQNTGLLKLFEKSQWEGMPGAAGPWSQAMARLPKALQENSRRVGGRGWSVPVRVFLQKPKER